MPGVIKRIHVVRERFLCPDSRPLSIVVGQRFAQVRPAPPRVAEPAIWAHHLITFKGTHIPASCTQPQHPLPRLRGPRLRGRAAGRTALDSRGFRGSAGRAERGGAGRYAAIPELAWGRIAPVSWV